LYDAQSPFTPIGDTANWSHYARRISKTKRLISILKLGPQLPSRLSPKNQGVDTFIGHWLGTCLNAVVFLE
jgi:hypothetical protein